MMLQASPSVHPSAGWKVAVIRARCVIERSLEDSPSLRPAVVGMVSDEIPSARKIVASTLAAYGEEPRVEIDTLTYSSDQVLDDWFPAA
jgi:hypothetical protein